MDKDLVLFTMQFARETGGTLNLGTEIEACKPTLEDTPGYLDYFMDRLYSLGYVADADPTTTETNYRIRASDFFLVYSEFPNFSVAELPPGIIKSDYNLGLSNILTLSSESFKAICAKL